MPRRPEFNSANALDAAMKQFWLKGYFDTSVDDLVSATGVSRYGLYGTFGGKHELFLKTLDAYRDGLVGQQLAGLETENAGWPEIVAYFNFLVALAAKPEGRAGCFMCNTATELAPHDEAASEKVGAHLERLQRVFRHALETAKVVGDLHKELDINRYADVLVGVTQGIFVLSRSSENQTVIQNVVSGTLKNPS